MSFAMMAKYFNELSDDPANAWRSAELDKSALNAPPDAMLPRHAAMLRADTYAIWVRWFIEGLCNPLRYVDDEKKTLIDVYADALERVDRLYPSEPQDEREDFARTIAVRVMREVERHRKLGRTGASSALKQELIDSAPHDPRCWICGYKFGQDAIDRFLKHRSGIKLTKPEFVDILRPRGLSERDVGIEVEHMVLVAIGGEAWTISPCRVDGAIRARVREPRSTTLEDVPQGPHTCWAIRLGWSYRIRSGPYASWRPDGGASTPVAAPPVSRMPNCLLRQAIPVGRRTRATCSYTAGPMIPTRSIA